MYLFNQDITETKPNTITQAYIAILNDNLELADSLFSELDCSRSRWGKALIEILRGKIDNFPTYFEIRNFFEIDLDFLIKNEKINYVEILLGSSELLINVNQEVFKYAARVLIENNYIEIGLNYLKKSKDVLYKDPEMHFMLTKYYLKKEDYTNALFYINECLKIVPDYFPAQKIKKNILKNLV